MKNNKILLFTLNENNHNKSKNNLGNKIKVNITSSAFHDISICITYEMFFFIKEIHIFRLQ